MKTIQEVCQEAITVQDACNLSGVAHSFLEAIAVLREYHPNKGTQFLNTHAVVTLYVSKLASLNGQECLCDACVTHFCNALNACKTVVGEGPSAPLPK